MEPGTWNLEPGTWNLEHAVATWALGAVLALMPAVALPQILTDPTRPPGAYFEPERGGAAGEGGLTLQSVMISPTHKSAIISGERVALGGKFGNATVVRISESEVVLKSGGSLQTLKMYPNVDKRLVVEKPAPKPRPRARRRAPAAGASGTGRAAK
ncbi:MAG: hypothetical protein HY323_03995 [Betaproteobacteria bacterium]|nr:hypothetical protein [Betaproteobacteria bacterium]